MLEAGLDHEEEEGRDKVSTFDSADLIFFIVSLGVGVRDVLQYRCITTVEFVVTVLHAEEINSSLHPESRHCFKQTHRRQIGQRRKTENRAVVCYT